MLYITVKEQEWSAGMAYAVKRTYRAPLIEQHLVRVNEKLCRVVLHLYPTKS